MLTSRDFSQANLSFLGDEPKALGGGILHRPCNHVFSPNEKIPDVCPVCKKACVYYYAWEW